MSASLDRILPLSADGRPNVPATAIGANILAEEIPLPAGVLLDGALRRNSRAMPEFLGGLGRATGAEVVLCPHGKTTMSPDLFRRQLGDGRWGISLATVPQVRVARHFGVSRVLLANQMVGRDEIAYVVGELRRDPSFEFLCLVDSLEGVRRLAEGVRAGGLDRPLDVLVEAGFEGGRCGVRTVADGVRLGRAVARAWPALRLRGVEGFEGLFQYRDERVRAGQARDFLRFVGDIALACAEQGLFRHVERVVLSAGGSAFYDIAARVLARTGLGRPSTVVIRSGCYLTHDHGLYAPLFDDVLRRDPLAREQRLTFVPALEVWGRVLSVPERRLAVLGVGRRDFGHDAGPPQPVEHVREGHRLTGSCVPHARITGINDQHCVIEPPATMSASADVRVGDLVALRPAHPCTTFDRWRTLVLVDDERTVLATLPTWF